MKYLVLVFLLAAGSAAAGPYLNLGLGGLTDQGFRYSHDGVDYTESTFGMIRAGWRFNSLLQAEFLHISSLESDKDDGINMLTIGIIFD